MDRRVLRQAAAWAVTAAAIGLGACERRERAEETEATSGTPGAEPAPGAAAAEAAPTGELETSPATADRTGRQLVGAFTQASPFDPDAPDHVWFDNGDGTLLFLHYDQPLAQATKVQWLGWGVKGRWCAEGRPEGFTHFHRTAKVGAWDAGHGGSKPGEDGYWLRHVALERLELPAMMGMPARTVAPGLDREFMPTNPPNCGA